MHIANILFCSEELFTDEVSSMFLLQMEIYGYREELLRPTVKHIVGFVMVWRCLCLPKVLHFIDGTMNQMYRDILKQNLKQLVRSMPNGLGEVILNRGLSAKQPIKGISHTFYYERMFDKLQVMPV